MSHELKTEVLILAGHLAPGEAMTAEDAERSLAHTVAHICADKSVSPVAMALIAVELACHIESTPTMLID